MLRKPATLALCLTEETRTRLSALARSRTAPARHVERSAIILHLGDRYDVSEIAAKLHIDRQRVARCLRRVMTAGPLEAIDDLPRSGRRPDITEAARTWLIGEACVKAKERGYPHELWTLCLLAAHAREHGPLAGHSCVAELAPSTVHEVLEVYAAAEMLRQMPEADRPAAVLSRAKAYNTSIAYRAAVRTWCTWCASRNLQTLPAAVPDVAVKRHQGLALNAIGPRRAAIRQMQAPPAVRPRPAGPHVRKPHPSRQRAPAPPSLPTPINQRLAWPLMQPARTNCSREGISALACVAAWRCVCDRDCRDSLSQVVKS